VTEDLERVHFNTAIAALMEQLNGLGTMLGPEEAPIPLTDDVERMAMREAIEVLAFGLAPFAPHLAEEIWWLLGNDLTLQECRWPAFDPSLVVAESVTYAVQVNGKLRGEVVVPVAATEADVIGAARDDAKVQPHLTDKTIRKTVFVPKRLVNFVVG
jgi:leucyl-tRNA synthetase